MTPTVLPPSLLLSRVTVSCDGPYTDERCHIKQLRPSRPSYQKAEAFGSHLDGAVALLKMRGKDVFQTVVGRKIFLILRSLLVSTSDPETSDPITTSSTS